MQIIKKDGTLENYDEQKIINACNKAARRAMMELSDEDYQIICNAVWDKLVENDLEETEIYDNCVIAFNALPDGSFSHHLHMPGQEDSEMGLSPSSRRRLQQYL